MLITPAEVFLPNRVPCGPRSTSMWSRFEQVQRRRAGTGDAPRRRRTVDTEGSTPGEVEMVRRCRALVNTVWSLLEALVQEVAPPAPGELMSLNVVPRFLAAAELPSWTTEMAIGTRLQRFRPVTGGDRHLADGAVASRAL